ncbi:sNPF [Drosophila busckii]|uniref:sNPF n=1 Tax=Drosophila busckii TaxID=30019 RepID=A0A0M5IWX6_DROBS|nr:sNPF [Drosophila busckii]
MRLFKSHQSYGCVLALFSLNLLLLQETSAELTTVQGAPISSLYDNLLQREYAGPIVFPNHQVERKAQRSPSLRLRFGRSDPDMLNNMMEKRWFGDVHQKPIRSPSLRLRFGRRDPNLPQMRRTPYDDLLERELTLNSQQNQPQADAANAVGLSDDYDTVFDRVVRKPQRLRWGRSVDPRMINNYDDERNQLEREIMDSTRLLIALQQKYDHLTGEHSDESNAEDQYEEKMDEQFQREVRKPMRLRWGRSTGKAPAEQKLPLAAAESASVAPNAQN